MLTKFAIDYTVMPEHNSRVVTHRTDDPIEAEEFLMHLLVGRGRIKEIRHDGTKVSDHQFNQMVKVAVDRIANMLLVSSLGIDSVEVKHRFGFSG
ncbi:hypothetical protein BH11VER1_BH11VER1_26000 [soil metagenome]